LSAVTKGLIFIKQANKLAIKEANLRKIASGFILFGLLLAIFFLIPLVLVLNFINDSFWQMICFGVIVAAFLSFCFAFAHSYDLGTAAAFDALERSGMISLQECRGVRRKGWQGAFIYGLAYPLLALTRWTPLRVRSTNSSSGRYERSWAKAHFLLIPIMGIESLKIRAAVVRIKALAVKNLLRFDPQTIKARLISTSITWLIIAAGMALGTWLGLLIGKDPFASDLTKLLAAAAGFLSAAVIAVLAIAWQAFIRIMLHTSVYRWLHGMEDVVDGSVSKTLYMPEILRKAINN